MRLLEQACVRFMHCVGVWWIMVCLFVLHIYTLNRMHEYFVAPVHFCTQHRQLR